MQPLERNDKRIAQSLIQRQILVVYGKGWASFLSESNGNKAEILQKDTKSSCVN